MYQIYANLLPFLKHNLELISRLTLSEEAYIFITCLYLTYFTSFYHSLSGCSVAHQAEEFVLFDKINGV